MPPAAVIFLIDRVVGVFFIPAGHHVIGGFADHVAVVHVTLVPMVFVHFGLEPDAGEVFNGKGAVLFDHWSERAQYIQLDSLADTEMVDHLIHQLF